MKNIRFFGLLAALSFFGAGCVNTTPPPPAASAPAPDTAVASRQAPAPPQTLRGLYTFGNEVNTFRDCPSGKTYWVNDESGSLDSLYPQATQPVPYPHEAVYAVVQGVVGPRETQGYASEYEGTLRVLQVDTLKNKSWMQACVPYEFWCLGTEPFWDLQISEAEQGIFYQDAGAESGLIFPWVAPTVRGNTWTYQTPSRDGKRQLRLTIKKEACSDGMSDTPYRYSATLQIDRETRRGCAIRKGEPVPEPN
jgi:uncharacterized membrane protein